MRFSKLINYKVVEFDGGILIMGAKDNLQRPGVEQLIVADSETIGVYITRYMHGREMGKTVNDAHRDALKGASIIEASARDMPGRLS